MPTVCELTEGEHSQTVLLHSQKMILTAIAKRMKCLLCAISTTLNNTRLQIGYKYTKRSSMLYKFGFVANLVA